MDLGILISELLLIPGTLLMTVAGFYLKNINTRMNTFLNEEEITELIDSRLAVVEVELEAIKDRLDRVENAIDRIESKIDDILSRR